MKQRAKHTLSHYRMVTANMGELFPVCCVPVLPGDTFQHHTSMLVRVSPLNTPVMHPVSVRIHHFFVPNRIVWPESENGGWEQFITGGPDGLNNQTPPIIATTDDKKAITSYLGIPPFSGHSVTSLSLRATNACINEYYRDQDLVPVRHHELNTLENCAWEKDYLTTARPWSQKGPEITLPIAGTAEVFHEGTGGSEQVTVRSGDTSDWVRLLGTPNVTTGPGDQDLEDQLHADLSTGSQININDFRAGFALQRYQEARARYGSRFTEYLRYCGITPSDARLQRPEYLGGGVARLNFSEVLQTTPSTEPDTAGVGDLYGHGIAGARTNRYRKFFEEHGFVITLCSVRPKAIYMNGLDREYLKTTKEDFFQKELANLGQQEVFNREVHLDHVSSGTFGYQDRYDEYRSHNSQVSQDFRDTLNSWHLARELPDTVALNEDFVKCDPSDRIFQVSTEDTLWIMANNHIVARRMVPRKANPRIL